MNYYPSSYYRVKARAALKGHWQTALLITLIVNLPTLLVQGVTTFTGNDPLDWFQALVISANRDGTMNREFLIRECTAFLTSTGFLVFQGLYLVAWLVTPCLALGMYKWLLDRLRGADGPVNTVFCRVHWFFKAIGLQLLIILKVLLWALPGAALLFLAGLLIRPGAGAARYGTYEAMLLPLTIAAAIPAAIAALRYALAEYIMAETPETGIRTCIRRSKELTQFCKKNLLLLLLSFFLMYLVIMLVASFLSGLGSGVLSMMFQIFADLALTLYMSCGIAAFYRRRVEDESAPKPKEEQKEEAVLS